MGTVEVKSQGGKDLAWQGKAGSFPLRVTEAPCTARGVVPPLVLPSCQLLHHIPLPRPALTTASISLFVMLMLVFSFHHWNIHSMKAGFHLFLLTDFPGAPKTVPGN